MAFDTHAYIRDLAAVHGLAPKPGDTGRRPSSPPTTAPSPTPLKRPPPVPRSSAPGLPAAVLSAAPPRGPSARSVGRK
jgi:hypothetical protein